VLCQRITMCCNMYFWITQSRKVVRLINFLKCKFFFPHPSILPLTSTITNFVKNTRTQTKLHPILPISKPKTIQLLPTPFHLNVFISQHGFSRTRKICHCYIIAFITSRIGVS
jgi:hypothetical protein